MSRTRIVAGGGRAVEVSADRVAGWFERFAARHGGARETESVAGRVAVRAGDGASAVVAVPFRFVPPEPGIRPGLVIEPLLAHLLTPRRVGLLLVRLGGFSVGVAEGGRVLVSSTDRKQVHGRNKAGGWSQQRFARRRDGQARVALRSAADAAARVLAPRVSELDAVLLGGDAAALGTLRADPRLAAVFELAQPRVLDVPEPRRTVLDDAAARADAVEIVVHDPAS